MARLGPHQRLLGEIDQVQISRIEVLLEESTPFPGTLYLCEDAEVLGRWLTRFRRDSLSRHLAFILPGGVRFVFAFALRADLVVLQQIQPRLGLGLSAQILQWLHEESAPLRVDLDQIRAELVAELLQNRYTSLASLLARARAAGLDLDAKRQVLLVEPEHPEAAFQVQIARGEAQLREQQLELLQSVRRMLIEVSPLHLVSLFGPGLVILLDERSMANADRLAGQVHQWLRSRKELPHHMVGIGNPVNRLDLLPLSLAQAQSALEVARLYRVALPTPNYEQLRMNLFLHRLQAHPELSPLLEEALQPLQQVETGYRKALLESLAAYIENSRSVQSAARSLGVHPNTLKYRIRRLEELLELRQVPLERLLLYYLAARILLIRLTLSS